MSQLDKGIKFQIYISNIFEILYRNSEIEVPYAARKQEKRLVGYFFGFRTFASKVRKMKQRNFYDFFIRIFRTSFEN